jgi:hypothetical protein
VYTRTRLSVDHLLIVMSHRLKLKLANVHRVDELVNVPPVRGGDGHAHRDLVQEIQLFNGDGVDLIKALVSMTDFALQQICEPC